MEEGYPGITIVIREFSSPGDETPRREITVPLAVEDMSAVRQFHEIYELVRLALRSTSPGWYSVEIREKEEQFGAENWWGKIIVEIIATLGSDVVQATTLAILGALVQKLWPAPRYATFEQSVSELTARVSRFCDVPQESLRLESFVQIGNELYHAVLIDTLHSSRISLLTSSTGKLIALIHEKCGP